MTRTVRRGGRYLDSGLYGCLAVGLPFANAAKLRHPESRVLLITGDGSVGFNFMEFHTAIRKGLPIVVVIANDQSWGMIATARRSGWGTAFPTGRGWDGWSITAWSRRWGDSAGRSSGRRRSVRPSRLPSPREGPPAST